MNADDLKKLTTESLKELAALLEQGRSERLIALLKTMGRFHRYSLHNVCLIVAQRPSATRVAGFHTWRSVGPSFAKARRASRSSRRSLDARKRTQRTAIRRPSSVFARRTSSTSSTAHISFPIPTAPLPSWRLNASYFQ